MSFVRRVLRFTITFGEGQFGDTAGNQIVLTGHRALVNVASYGGESQGELNARLYGLPISIINQLTTIGPIMTQIRGKNTIQVDAGDEGGTLSTIYNGTILNAWGDFQSAPDVALVIQALGAGEAAVKPAAASSFQGSTDVATIMQGLATRMGMSFEGNGVNIQLSSPYFSGTLLDQVKACAIAARINFVIENNTLAIWPTFSARTGDVPTVSPQSGLVGYPSFSSNGVLLKTIFLPNARNGGLITVKNSSIPMANGTWTIYQVNHELASEFPDGPWFSNLGVWLNVNA